jgi:uncharacterized lipoprotein
MINSGVDNHILFRDGIRNVWRKTIGALEELDYDIEDKNRESGMIYLNIVEGGEGRSMLSTVSFWKNEDTVEYIVSLDRLENGIAVRVLDKDKKRVRNDVSKDMYVDLMSQFKP